MVHCNVNGRSTGLTARGSHRLLGENSSQRERGVASHGGQERQPGEGELRHRSQRYTGHNGHQRRVHLLGRHQSARVGVYVRSKPIKESR